ncbi:MAG TPA: DUF2891 family protein [Kofleriaceae bacterium]|nr:DUF2891 family protein [Kofleriaceae bacterium]
MDADEAARYAGLALECVHRAYPNQIVHMLEGDEEGERVAPRSLYPVFWGCFDWHSAVHGHWTLAAFARRFAAAPLAARARAALETSFARPALEGELAYLERRPAFERPYGLAWLCALHGELHAWARVDADAAAWAGDVAPLAELGARRVAGWMERLTHPTRVGTHAQSAFGAGLVLDWARSVGEDALAARVAAAAVRLHRGDRGPALHLEPSGEDFLSPSLGAADLMRRVLAAEELAVWLSRALPELGGAAAEEEPTPDALQALVPPQPADRSDGRLVHLDGLNASRAWMLAAVARALPPSDARRVVLFAAADLHARAALDALAAQGYAGGHWLGTFAMYLRLADERVPGHSASADG